MFDPKGKGLFSVSCMGILVAPATLDLRVRKLTEPTGVHAPLRRRRKSMKSTEGKERGVSDNLDVDDSDPADTLPAAATGEPVSQPGDV